MKKKLLFIMPCCLTILSACGNKQSKETYQLPNPRVELYDVSDFEIIGGINEKDFFAVSYSQAINNVAKASALTSRYSSYELDKTPLSIPNYDYDDISFMYWPAYDNKMEQSIGHIDLYANDVADYIIREKEEKNYLSGYKDSHEYSDVGSYVNFYDEKNGEVSTYTVGDFDLVGSPTEHYCYVETNLAYFDMGIEYLRESNYFDLASEFFDPLLIDSSHLYSYYDYVSVGRKGNTFVISANLEYIDGYESKLTDETDIICKPRLNKNGLHVPSENEVMYRVTNDVRCVFEQVNGQYRLVEEQSVEKYLLYCDEEGNPSKTPLEVGYFEYQCSIEYNKRTQKKIDLEKDSDGKIIADGYGDNIVKYALYYQETKTSPSSRYFGIERSTNYLLENGRAHFICEIDYASFYFSIGDALGNTVLKDIYSIESSKYITFDGDIGLFKFKEKGVYYFTLNFDEFLTLTSIDIGRINPSTIS